MSGNDRERRERELADARGEIRRLREQLAEAESEICRQNDKINRRGLDLEDALKRVDASIPRPPAEVVEALREYANNPSTQCATNGALIAARWLVSVTGGDDGET